MIRSSIVVCPGCGWHGSVAELRGGACPNTKCKYESDIAPYRRLMTLGELVLSDAQNEGWNQVDLPTYIRSLFAVFGITTSALSQPYAESEAISAAFKVGDRVCIIGGAGHVGEEAEVASVEQAPWFTLRLGDGVTMWLAKDGEIELENWKGVQ